MSDRLVLFRVVRDSDRTRVETDGDTLGWGVKFPSGMCYVDWNRRVYAEEDRLNNPHVSQYGSLNDVEQGTGGAVKVMTRRRVEQ